jgi:hypothetical protein
MADKPMLYVCHGDEGGPRVHPCRRVQEALKAKGIGTFLTHSRDIIAWVNQQP